MTVRVFAFGTVVTAIASIAITLAIINYLSPSQAGFIGYFLFFLSLFLSISSTTAIIGFVVRRFIARHVLAAYAVRTSLRQGIFLGLFFNLLLVLQLIKLYAWWLGIIVIVIFTIIEIIFLSYDRTHFRRSGNAPA